MFTFEDMVNEAKRSLVTEIFGLNPMKDTLPKAKKALKKVLERGLSGAKFYLTELYLQAQIEHNDYLFSMHDAIKESVERVWDYILPALQQLNDFLSTVSYQTYDGPIVREGWGVDLIDKIFVPDRPNYEASAQVRQRMAFDYFTEMKGVDDLLKYVGKLAYQIQSNQLMAVYQNIVNLFNTARNELEEIKSSIARAFQENTIYQDSIDAEQNQDSQKYIQQQATVNQQQQQQDPDRPNVAFVSDGSYGETEQGDVVYPTSGDNAFQIVYSEGKGYAVVDLNGNFTVQEWFSSVDWQVDENDGELYYVVYRNNGDGFRLNRLGFIEGTVPILGTRNVEQRPRNEVQYGVSVPDVQNFDQYTYGGQENDNGYTYIYDGN